MKSTIRIAFCILLSFLFFGSCDSFKDDEYDDYREESKNIDGTWRLKTVSRNGIDITGAMDFSQFRLNLNEDGSYTIDNYLPFVVKKEGQWAVDDPQYPFNLTLRENGSNENVTVKIKYPIANGSRILSITLSPGCYSNSYQYVFEQVTTH